ncbi:MAG: TetR/AcrR family transcriptional regulator [Turneriella sp.]|nr:TetR/AcrR family transcriptional regulator [Turneriella sp.]
MKRNPRRKNTEPSGGKSAATRRHIYETALRLFQKNGFEETTMRQVAKEAGVALGGAYYYFASKDEVVMEFYRDSQADAVAGLEVILKEEKRLGTRIIRMTEERLALFRPYKKLMWVLARNAVLPDHPLSPFGAATAEIRGEAMALFERCIADAKPSAPRLAASLPTLLWLYQMGIIFFWITDTSKDEARTRRLLHTTAQILETLIGYSSLPIFKGTLSKITELVTSLSESGKSA